MKIEKWQNLNILVLAVLASTAVFGSAIAGADVAADFTLTEAAYVNTGDEDGGDVILRGIVDSGAVQSGKSVVVDVSYEYAFRYQIGEEVVTTKTVYCPQENSKDGACREQRRKGTDVERDIATTSIVLKTYTLSAMTEITEAAWDSEERFNPKGKITGYDWKSRVSILPFTIIPEPNLIPEGGRFVEGSVWITGVFYSACLKDRDHLPIGHTAVSGALFTASR